jgi:4-methyl-5(b-hydroxyethyl)-thiazole monophosphate biosynthesis
MKKRVLCLLVDGFEEIEFVAPVDLLRRADIEVVTAALHGTSATGRSGIRVMADTTLAEVYAPGFDLLLIPGGPGVGELRRDRRAAELACQFANSGKMLAAICAAPLVLMDAGLLDGRRFTAHHSVRETLPAVSDERVVVDGNLITSRGAGTAIDFGLAIVALLTSQQVADRIAGDIMA